MDEAKAVLDVLFDVAKSSYTKHGIHLNSFVFASASLAMLLARDVTPRVEIAEFLREIAKGFDTPESADRAEEAEKEKTDMAPRFEPADKFDKNSVENRTYRSVMRAMLRLVEEEGLPPREVARGLLTAALDIALLELRFYECAQFVADTCQERFLDNATGVAGGGLAN
jgi:hypothetical protein